MGPAAGAGPVGVELKWEETSGTVSGNNCTTTGGNRCRGTFGIVQRTFSATADRSGPVKQVEIYEGGVPGANSFVTGTTHDLVVRIAHVHRGGSIQRGRAARMAVTSSSGTSGVSSALGSSNACLPSFTVSS